MRSLRRNQIYERGERSLAQALSDYNRTLTSLDLRGNPRPAAGVALTQAALGQGLATGRHAAGGAAGHAAGEAGVVSGPTLALLAGVPIRDMCTAAITEVL